MRLFFHRVVVDGFLRVQAVADHVEPFARHVQRHAVGQVAAFGQAHAHDGVARLEERHEGGNVGAGAAVRLHVGGLGAEQLLDAVDGQLLGHVDMLAATVVAAARIAFGVLVGQLRAGGGQHRRRGVVLAGNQLDVVFLALVLGADGGPELGVGVGDGVAGTVEHGGPWGDVAPGVRPGRPRRTAERACRARRAVRFPVVAHVDAGPWAARLSPVAHGRQFSLGPPRPRLQDRVATSTGAVGSGGLAGAGFCARRPGSAAGSGLPLATWYRRACSASTLSA